MQRVCVEFLFLCIDRSVVIFLGIPEISLTLQFRWNANRIMFHSSECWINCILPEKRQTGWKMSAAEANAFSNYFVRKNFTLSIQSDNTMWFLHFSLVCPSTFLHKADTDTDELFLVGAAQINFQWKPVKRSFGSLKLHGNKNKAKCSQFFLLIVFYEECNNWLEKLNVVWKANNICLCICQYIISTYFEEKNVHKETNSKLDWPYKLG